MNNTRYTITLTAKNFESKVLGSKVLFMVNFRAEWSGPCHIMAPVVDEMAIKFGGQVQVGILDVDKNTEISARFGIHTVPVLLFFYGGELVEQIFGAISRKELSTRIVSLLQTKTGV